LSIIYIAKRYNISIARFVKISNIAFPPLPPAPIPAMFSLSLGATNPLPNTWRGTIKKPPAARVVSLIKFLREEALGEFSVIEQSFFEIKVELNFFQMKVLINVFLLKIYVGFCLN
jgi:hypothetical protein